MELAVSPFVAPETEAWAEAARAGVLLIKRCLDCGEPHYYPRPFCPFCFSQRTEYVAASGTGSIYSYSVTRVGGEPYAIAYVTLDEGPTIMTNIVDTPFESIEIGRGVSVVFRESSLGFPAPMFRVVEALSAL
jgi:uncharacterized OB-fold protein